MFYPESFPSIHSLKILCRTFPTRGFVVVLSCIVFVVPSSLTLILLVVIYDISTIFSLIFLMDQYTFVKIITIIIMILPFCSFTKCTLPLSTFVIPVMTFLINLTVSFKALLHQSGIIK